MLQSGIYAFSVRAVDNAGNTGLGTSPLTFTVDASLPVNSTSAVISTGSDSSGVNVLIVGVLAGQSWRDAGWNLKQLLLHAMTLKRFWFQGRSRTL